MRRGSVGRRSRGRFDWRPWGGLAVGVLGVGLGAAVVAGLVVPRSGGGEEPARAPVVESRPLAVGQPAPDFQGVGFDGSTVQLSALRGRPVLVNFFASWCTSCAHELPAIQAAYAAHQGQGFVVVGVNTLETGDGRRFYRGFGLSFPALADPGDPGRIGAAYHVTNGLPASVFVRRDGTVDLIVPGEITRAAIEAELARIS